MAILTFISLMLSLTLIFSGRKADFTSKQNATMQEISQKIAQDTKQPINVNLYISEDLSENYPELEVHKQNLLRLLEKYQILSDGKIGITIKNPEPYSAEEYEAKSIGIRPFADPENTHNMYFGASFSNGEGKKFVIPYFSVQRENYLEYDISRIIDKLNHINKKNIGVVSFAGNISDWQIIKKLKQDYRVIFLNNKAPTIPSNIQTLFVYNPQQVDSSFIYALDQYVMRGGNLIVFIDPYAEVVAQKYPYTKRNKNLLLPLLAKWGIKMDETKVVADVVLSQTEYSTTLTEKNSPTSLTITSENMNIPQQLGKNWLKISFLSAGNLQISPISGAQYHPIFYTTEKGETIETDVVKYQNIDAINNALSSEQKRQIMAYWIEGNFSSMFDNSPVKNSALEKDFPPFIPSSLKPSKILLIADSDFIADEIWNLTGYQKDADVYDQIAANNNADFILSVVDYMNGNENLAKLRVKSLINDNQSIAEQIYIHAYKTHADEYKEKEQKVKQLQKELDELQQKLNSGQTGMTLLKIQQLDEINRKRQEILEEIKALNYKIQQESSKKINTIILINMLIAPLLLLLLVFFFVRLYIFKQNRII